MCVDSAQTLWASFCLDCVNLFQITAPAYEKYQKKSVAGALKCKKRGGEHIHGGGSLENSQKKHQFQIIRRLLITINKTTTTTTTKRRERVKIKIRLTKN